MRSPSPAATDPEDRPDDDAGTRRPASRFGLPRTARLLAMHEFRRVYRHGRRAHGRHLVVVALPRREPGHRLGLAVSKEHGRAVRRNKIKRLLREAFRLERPTLVGQFDLVLLPQKFDGRLALADVRHELVQLITGLHRGTGGERRGDQRGRGRGRR